MKRIILRTMRGLLLGVMVSAMAPLFVTQWAHAQNYPNRDITFIVPFAPGGSSDPLCRQFTSQLGKILHGNINIENKTGGSATIGTGAVVRAKPDGYTIGEGSNGSLVYQTLVTSGLPFKSPDDYQPIVKLVDQHSLIAVRADAPWKDFAEFLADVRKNPGKIRAAVSGMGGATTLALQHFNKVAGVKITPVPFTGGGGEALVALLGGRVEVTVGHNISMLGHERAGKIRVLAVLKKDKDDLFPNATPAFAGSGHDQALPSSFYVIAPKGLPKDVLDKLVSGSLQVVRSQEYLNFMKANGYGADAKGPEEIRKELIEYRQIYSDLIKVIDQK
jgi:tripartite-type tricarboxylate transporter receptor subunit TctC